MSLEENQAVVRRYFEEVWSRGNLAIVDELTVPDFVRHSTTTPGGVQGHDAFKAYVTRNRAAFQDFHVTVDDVFAAGEKVAVRWTGHGIHRGEYAGIAPTDKPVSVTGINILRLAGGKLVEEWMNFDALGLQQQLMATAAAR